MSMSVDCQENALRAEPIITADSHTPCSDSPLIPEEEPNDLLNRFYAPRMILFIFTALNLVTYFDRGAISGCLSSIRVDPKIRGDALSLTDTRSGALASGFMVGFMCTCPLFVMLGGRFASKVIILGGMLVWCLTCISTAFAQNYWMLLFSRVFVGVGEAAFVGFTVTIIDNIAPTSTRTLWLGIFYSMIPVGTAIGMAVGGVVSDQSFNLPFESWRTVFIGEVIVSIPILAMIAFLPEKYEVRRYAENETYVTLPKATMMLVRNLNYILVVVGYAMYCFVVGAISVWAIPMLQQGPMHLTATIASIVMGGATALCGMIGSVIGGVSVDFLGGSKGLTGTAKCQIFDVAMVAISIPCGVAAFFLHNLIAFIVAFCISVIALFAVTAPVNAAILTVVPLDIRPYAVSYSVFLIHLLGDFPSPTIVGAISDRLSQGCPSIRNREDCMASSSGNCYWMGQEGDSSSHCVNVYQLRNALLVVFAFLCLAIPCWLWVYFRIRKVLNSAEN